MEAVSPRFFESFREPVAVGADPLAEKATEEVTCPVAVDIEIAGDPDSCYVCLSSEGALLMNVCDCRWARIHPECLGKLLKEQKSSECKVRIRATLFFFPSRPRHSLFTNRSRRAARGSRVLAGLQGDHVGPVQQRHQRRVRFAP